MTSNLRTDELRTVCKNLGLRVGSRENMIRAIDGQIKHNPRKRKRNQLYNYHHQPKRLPVILTPDECARRIAKWYRYWSRSKWQYVNDSDFITMEPIELRQPFRLIEDTQHVYQFHPLSLANWFLKEGNFINPYTRTPLNTVELRRLDRQIRLTGEGGIPSLADEYRRITLERKQEREHEQTCILLHTESLQLLVDIVNVTNGALNVANPMVNIICFLTEVSLPRYFHVFRQLYMLDSEFATESVLHIFNSLQQLKSDERITYSRERYSAIEMVQQSISMFTKNVLPVLHTMSDMMVEDFTLPVAR